LEDDFGIAQTHSTIGELNKKQKKYPAALQHFNISLEIFKKTNSALQLEKVYKLLAETYQLIGDLNASLKNYKLFVEMKDSIYEKDLSQQFVEMNTKYETEKKQEQNELLTTKNKLSEETIKEQKVFSYFIITALLLLSGLAYFIFRGLKQQKKANRIISKQKKEVEFQKTLVEEHQRETIDSINYAKRIQYALLANKELLTQNLPEHFVLFNPKDIVSGDFYWATEHNNKFYLAVCDSTGHGVPGAFMCLLNMGFLSEAIKEKNISKPNEILNYVRQRLIDSIGNDGQQDGMDAILICIDKSLQFRDDPYAITYAAANNEPVLVRDDQIIILPKDKMPVGKGERTESFKLQTINLNKGDVLYLYTDGYADQFGGPKGKKFKYKPLNELLLAVSKDEMAKQREVLSTNFVDWKSSLEQVDDVCIIGIKI
jgi:serine phosphatase RsbU (regulator of sigma subunit)